MKPPIKFWPWEWRAKPEEPTEYKEAPFEMRDHDGPSHLWVIAYILEDKHGMKATADNIRRRASEWAAEREK